MAQRNMNIGIGTVPAQFLSWEYLFRIFGIVSLQCFRGGACDCAIDLGRGCWGAQRQFCVKGLVMYASAAKNKQEMSYCLFKAWPV
jgi:hypothetical protein